MNISLLESILKPFRYVVMSKLLTSMNQFLMCYILSLTKLSKGLFYMLLNFASMLLKSISISLITYSLIVGPVSAQNHNSNNSTNSNQNNILSQHTAQSAHVYIPAPNEAHNSTNTNDKEAQVQGIGVTTTGFNEISELEEAVDKIKKSENVISENDSSQVVSQNVNQESDKKIDTFNLTLTVIRFFLNTGTTTAGLVYGKNIDLGSALLIGVLTGSITAAFQYKTLAFGQWIDNSHLLIKTAQKLKLLSKKAEADYKIAEKALKEAQKYSKWGLAEAAFLGVTTLAMVALNIPVNDNLISTVLLTTATQGFYDIGAINLTKSMKNKFPDSISKIDRSYQLAIFFGSGISVFAAISSLIGLPIGETGFILLMASGAIFNLYPAYDYIKKQYRIKSCQKLFAN